MANRNSPARVRSVTIKATGQRLNVIARRPNSRAVGRLKSDVSFLTKPSNDLAVYALIAFDDAGNPFGSYCIQKSNAFSPHAMPSMVKSYIEFLIYECS